MARSNGNGTLVHWARNEQAAPYRASINGDCHWDVMAPAPDLAACMRVSPGGRLLAAFELAEVRDLFVDGHLAQGAQVEPDFATRARARATLADPMTADLETIELSSWEASNSEFVLAAEANHTADNALFAFARPRIEAFKAEGKITDALRLRNALPGDTMAKVLLLDLVRPVDPSEVTKAGSAPLTPELAKLSLAWQQAHRRERKLADMISEFSGQHGRRLFDEGKAEELTSFIASTRYHVARSMLLDMQRYGNPKPAAAVSDPTP